MKPTESQIEDRLRNAPRLSAPAGLKDKLSDQIQLPTKASAASNIGSSLRPTSWWQRWWPALVPGAASLAFAVVIAVQQNEIASLQQSIRDLNATISAATNTAPAVVDPTPASSPVTHKETEAEEMARLGQRVAELTSEIGQLESVQKDNESLRTQLAAPAGLNQQELDALAAAKERSQSIRCVNNLKQIALAVRLFAMGNNKVNPPDFLSMSNELNTPKILFCPGNTNHPLVKTWAEFAETSSSYEYLAAGATNADWEPQRISTRCPIHNNIGLCDGSIQGVSKKHPEFIVERDGKLYLDMNVKPANPNP